MVEASNLDLQIYRQPRNLMRWRREEWISKDLKKKPWMNMCSGWFISDSVLSLTLLMPWWVIARVSSLHPFFGLIRLLIFFASMVGCIYVILQFELHMLVCSLIRV